MKKVKKKTVTFLGGLCPKLPKFLCFLLQYHVFHQQVLKILTSVKEEQITFRFLAELVINITATERERNGENLFQCDCFQIPELRGNELVS